MKLTSSIVLGLAAATSAAVMPKGAPYDHSSGKACLNQDVAAKIVDGFGSLLTAFDVNVANSLLAPNLTDTSGSINFLTGHSPLNDVTFPSRDAFIAGQGAQPPIDFTLLGIDAVTCEGVIAFRWLAGVGTRQLQANGINILYTSKCEDASKGVDGWQITKIFSEFNSAAWVVDFGGSCVSPAAGAHSGASGSTQGSATGASAYQSAATPSQSSY